MEPSKDTAGSALEPVYPVPGHPPMRPEPGFFEFVSFSSPCSCFHLNFRPFDTNSGMAGPAEEANLQGLLGPIAEGSGRGGGESHRDRVGQEGKGAEERGEAAEVGSTGSRRGCKQ